MSTLNIPLLYRGLKDFPELLPFASGPHAMIIPKWLELRFKKISIVPVKFHCI